MGIAACRRERGRARTNTEEHGGTRRREGDEDEDEDEDEQRGMEEGEVHGGRAMEKGGRMRWAVVCSRPTHPHKLSPVAGKRGMRRRVCYHALTTSRTFEPLLFAWPLSS